MSGAPVPKSYIRQVGEIARANNLKLHIDGARIFNAATALNTTVTDLTADADSVQFCFSKGLVRAGRLDARRFARVHRPRAAHPQESAAAGCVRRAFWRRRA